MKNYEFKLVAKCYTREGNLNRPRRSKSHCEKVAVKQHWKADVLEYLLENGTLGLLAEPVGR